MSIFPTLRKYNRVIGVQLCRIAVVQFSSHPCRQWQIMALSTPRLSQAMETMKIASYPRFRSTYCCTPPCSLSSRPPLSCIVYCSCSHCFQHRCWSLIRPRPGLDLYTFPAPFLRIQVCPKIKLHQSSSSTAKQSNSANMYGPAQSHQQHPQLLTIHQDNFDFEG